MIMSGVEIFLRSIYTFAVSDGAQLSLVLRFHIEVSGAQNRTAYEDYDFMDVDPPEYNREAMAMGPLGLDSDAMDVDPPQSDDDSDAMDVDVPPL